MADSVQEDLTALRHETQMISKLVENLYITQYRAHQDGADRFARFAQHLTQEIEGLTIPGADPALADHASQGWRDAIVPILDRILAALTEIQGEASSR